MNVEGRTRGDRRVITVQGEIDLSNVDVLREALEDDPNGSGTLVLDLRNVAFMDSMALGVILEASLRTADDGRAMRIVCGPAAQRVIEAAGLDGRLELGDADDVA